MGGKSSKLRPEVLADIQDETGFTAVEIRDLYRQFRYDCKTNEGEDHSRMGLVEFKRIYVEYFPEGNADGFAEQVFRTFDKDGTGKIDFREFITSLSIQINGTREEKLNWAFDLYDIDQTGVIKRDEALTIISAIFKLKIGSSGQDAADPDLCPETVVDHLFKRADTDKDGKISKKDFLEGVAESRTVCALFEGAADAAALPYVARKDSTGSYGRSRSSSLLQSDSDDDRSRSGTL